MSKGPSEGALGIDSSSAMSQEGSSPSPGGGGGRVDVVSGRGMICFTLGASMYEADQSRIMVNHLGSNVDLIPDTGPIQTLLPSSYFSHISATPSSTMAPRGIRSPVVPLNTAAWS